MLMTYGSPASDEDVPRYVKAVRGGRDVPDAVVAEMRRRYAVIGGSPLIRITQAQAAALEERLGRGVIVRAAMRFSKPYIAEVLDELASAGVDDVVAVVMSPQYSPLLMSGYGRAVDEARAAMADRAPRVLMADAWHDEPAFLTAVAGRIDQAIARLPSGEQANAPVLLTAHSLPRRVAEQEPGYVEQLQRTAEAVAATAGIPAERWTFCWQSAGHEPGEWMKPDFADLMPELAAAGHRCVVVAPIQFLADHLEILYDIDVGAREQAEAAGLRFERIESLNVDPRFIDALARVVGRTLPAPSVGRRA
jgi:protoporphyrin/coproporphyrin ferrochelatase